MSKDSTDNSDSGQSALARKLEENYPKIILAILILLVGVSFISKPTSTNKTETENKDNTNTAEVVEKAPASGDTYQVKKMDTLWSIAEKNYDSGYAWADIARANNLKNANNIEVGQKLTMPKVTVKKTTTGEVAKTSESAPQPQTGKVTITGSTYTVVAGDSLWSIALRAYGDGYAWVKIAKENKLMNPNVIHKGNVLKLPR